MQTAAAVLCISTAGKAAALHQCHNQLKGTQLWIAPCAAGRRILELLTELVGALQLKWDRASPEHLHGAQE